MVIKLFEEYYNEVEEISHREYNKSMRTMKVSTFIKDELYEFREYRILHTRPGPPQWNRKGVPHEASLIKEVSLDYNNREITINKYEDEWYLVKIYDGAEYMKRSRYLDCFKYYKCDQFYSVIKLIKSL